MKYIILFLFLLGISKNINSQNIDNDPPATNYYDEYIELRLYESLKTDSILYYLGIIENEIESLKTELLKTTPSEADELYLNLSSRIKNFGKIENLTAPVINRWGYTTPSEEAAKDDSFILSEMEKVGLIPIYIGEGYAELGTDTQFYLDLFAPYLSDEIKDFAIIITKTDRILIMDAGLVVPIETLIQWCIDWEGFLNKYPNTKRGNTAINDYAQYMALIMFCTYDNTQAFDRDTKEIDEYLLQVINKAITEYPECQTTSTLSQYVKELEKNGYIYFEGLEEKIFDTGILKEVDLTNLYY